jgi:hypothetical protein
MSEHEEEIYRSYYDAVRQQIGQMRVILQGVEAKAKERQWLKLKTSGDLDDLYVYTFSKIPLLKTKEQQNE